LEPRRDAVLARRLRFRQRMWMISRSWYSRRQHKFKLSFSKRFLMAPV